MRDRNSDSRATGGELPSSAHRVCGAYRQCVDGVGDADPSGVGPGCRTGVTGIDRRPKAGSSTAPVRRRGRLSVRRCRPDRDHPGILRWFIPGSGCWKVYLRLAALLSYVPLGAWAGFLRWRGLSVSLLARAPRTGPGGRYGDSVTRTPKTRSRSTPRTIRRPPRVSSGVARSLPPYRETN